MHKKILIVEDDLALKPIWEVIVQKNLPDYDVDWSVSGEEANRLFVDSFNENSSYDLIVVDLFLAGSETGLDFISHVRRRDSATPIFLVSSVAEQDVKQHYLKNFDNVHFLSKPLNISKCKSAIRGIGLQGQSA